MCCAPAAGLLCVSWQGGGWLYSQGPHMMESQLRTAQGGTRCGSGVVQLVVDHLPALERLWCCILSKACVFRSGRQRGVCCWCDSW
jgi:hypothetical protein